MVNRIINRKGSIILITWYSICSEYDIIISGGDFMKKYNFTILIEKDEDGVYVGSVPALKGCHTQAKTVEELLPRIKEAIELCLETEDDGFFQNEFVGVQQIEVVV
jgi:predicted RNase H-like HicB family nuclease